MKSRFFTLLILSMLAFPLWAYADAAASQAPAWLKGLSDSIPSAATGGVGIMILAGIVDLVLKRWPTAKPIGLLYIFGDCCKVVGEGLIKLGKLSDAILPQKLKSEPAPASQPEAKPEEPPVQG